ADSGSGGPRRPRHPAAVLSVLVVVMVTLIATVAITTREQAPPTIAEFAPQAVTQIKVSLTPHNQLGLTGPPLPGSSAPPPAPRTPGASNSPGTPPGSTAPSAAPPIYEPRVLDCVGNRQTEDPQSPPCIPYWQGNNGGATYPGVTATTITIAWSPDFLEDTTQPPLEAQFFNARYEFYGRKIALQEFTATGSGNSPNPANMVNDAITVSHMPAFASLGYSNSRGSEYHYYDALAARGVISAAYRGETEDTAARFAAHAPYEWNVLPGVDTMLANIGQFVCAQLAGQPPSYAGTGVSNKPVRTFGLIYEKTTDGSAPNVSQLQQELAGCHASPAATVVYQETGSGGQESTTGENDILQMKTKGVTSIICVCDIADTRGVFMPSATSEGYQPEWVVSSYLDQDLDNSYSGGNAPPDQIGHVIGVDFRNKFLPAQDMPWYWAVREADPQDNPSGNTYYAADSRYEELALIAAGIQLAGPDLTPASFARGLQEAQFPNPGAGQAPYYQAAVGFPGGRYTMTDSATMVWYNPTQQGTIDPSTPGAICYVDHGLRYSEGQWAERHARFYAGSCL
ncbi:MAG: type 1 periplasmic-binding domain-containing protein, partial [Mycobacteriales bacterium]